jgi:hypothetical protein
METAQRNSFATKSGSGSSFSIGSVRFGGFYSDLLERGGGFGLDLRLLRSAWPVFSLAKLADRFSYFASDLPFAVAFGD